MKLSFLLILLQFINCSKTTCKAQFLKEQDYVFVLKIKYFKSAYSDYRPQAYLIIAKDIIDSLNIHPRDTGGIDELVYRLTLKGGIYLSNPLSDIFELSCCEYGEVGIPEAYRDTLLKQKLSEYPDNFSINRFKKKFGASFVIKSKKIDYKITAWLTNLNFCVCNLYMERPNVRIFGQRAAYLHSIGQIKKPSKGYMRQLKSNLKRLIQN